MKLTYRNTRSDFHPLSGWDTGWLHKLYQDGEVFSYLVKELVGGYSSRGFFNALRLSVREVLRNGNLVMRPSFLLILSEIGGKRALEYLAMLSWLTPRERVELFCKLAEHYHYDAARSFFAEMANYDIDGCELTEDGQIVDADRHSTDRDPLFWGNWYLLPTYLK